mgnify:CR=1 FL=1
MTEAVFRALLDAILILFRRRASSVLRALPAESTAAGADAVAESLFHEVVEHRRLAHSAGVLFLRGQARQHGGDEAWVPRQSPYSRRALRQGLREVPGGLRRGNEPAVQRVLEHHVEAAGRQAVARAVMEAPPDPDGMREHLDGLEKDLKKFPPSVRKAARRAAAGQTAEEEQQVARRQAKEEQRRKARKAEKKARKAERKAEEERPRLETAEERAARRRKALDDAFGKIADRIGEAIEDVEAEEPLRRIVRERAPLAVEDPPDRDRTDRRGRRILKAFAWARVVHPGKHGPCGFCAMLAGRGPVYKTQGTAAFAYHYGDRCTVVPVFTSRTWPGKKAAAGYAATYDKVVRGKDLHGAEARSAMDKALRGTRSREKSARRKERTNG